MMIVTARIWADVPVAHQWSQHHQAVLHAGDDLWCAVPSQEKFSSGLKVGKSESLVVPLSDHLLQLLFDIPLFHRADTDVLRGHKQKFKDSHSNGKNKKIYKLFIIHRRISRKPNIQFSRPFPASIFHSVAFMTFNILSVLLNLSISSCTRKTPRLACLPHPLSARHPACVLLAWTTASF